MSNDAISLSRAFLSPSSRVRSALDPHRTADGANGCSHLRAVPRSFFIARDAEGNDASEWSPRAKIKGSQKGCGSYDLARCEVGAIPGSVVCQPSRGAVVDDFAPPSWILARVKNTRSVTFSLPCPSFVVCSARIHAPHPGGC